MMKRLLPVLLGLAALLAFPLPASVADGADESLLERLSAETAALTAKADAHSAVLVFGVQRRAGVLVGDPARFVVALDDVPEHGSPPAQGRVTLADGAAAEALLLDADTELGLAVYELSGTKPAGLALASASALKRGALVVSGGRGDPALLALGEVGGPLDDLALAHDDAIAVLAPGGGLLGLRPSWAGLLDVESASCMDCHGATAQSELLRVSRYLVPQGQGVARTGPDLADVTKRSTQDGDYLRLYLTRLGHSLPHSRMPYFHGQVGHSGRGVVPAPVIERALADLAQGGRLRRPYLGVVVEGEMNGKTFDLASGRLVHFFSPGDADRVTVGNTARWLDTRMPTFHWGGAASDQEISSVRLASVLPDSPAAKADLKTGLEIVELDGRPFAGARGFARALARRRPGEQVRLAVKGWAEPVVVVLADREKEGRDLATAATAGLTVQTLTRDLLAYLGLSGDTKGVVVSHVEPGSPAAAVAIQRGDVLVADRDGAPIRDPGELDAILGAAKGTVLLTGRRGQQNVVFQLTLPERVTPRKTR
jgi:S1-C subfamily serine protease